MHRRSTDTSAWAYAGAWAFFCGSRIVQVDQTADQKKARADDLTRCGVTPRESVRIIDGAVVGEVRERVGCHCASVATTEFSAARTTRKKGKKKSENSQNLLTDYP